MTKKISIVIPVFNSHQYLYNFISNLILIISKKFKNFEVILIDDCSSDDSWKVIEQLSLSFDKIIKAIQLRKNVGQHNAIFLGLKYCEGDIIITMDDDGQNSPDNIEEMIKKMENGYDVCYANYKIKKHNLFRRFGSYINNICTSVLFKKPLSLILTSFRVFKK